MRTNNAFQRGLWPTAVTNSCLPIATAEPTLPTSRVVPPQPLMCIRHDPNLNPSTNHSTQPVLPGNVTMAAAAAANYRVRVQIYSTRGINDLKSRKKGSIERDNL